MDLQKPAKAGKDDVGECGVESGKVEQGGNGGGRYRRYGGRDGWIGPGKVISLAAAPGATKS